MQIGSDFNKKCEKLILETELIAQQNSDTSVSVEELNRNLGFDRNELRSYLEYLSDRKFIELLSIGGPLLYGHIRITEKGLQKALSLRDK